VTTPETITLERWVCTCCGYVYDPVHGDPEHGVPPGTPFEKLPDGWTCPMCHALKKAFDLL
jgi:rubredoxin